MPGNKSVNRLYFGLFILLSILGVPSSIIAQQFDTSKLPAGQTYQLVSVSSSAPISLHLLKLDSASFSARVAVVKDRLQAKSVSGSPSLASWLLADFAREYKANAVV